MNAYAPLFAAILGLIAYLTRAAAPTGGFWHTKWGQLVLTLVGGVTGAGAAAVAAHGFDKTAIILAVSGAVGALVGSANPSISTSNLSKLPIYLAFFAMGTMLTACPAATSLGKCELNSLPANLESVIAEVVAIAMNPASVVTDLETLAGKVGPSQVSCASQAYQVWLQTNGTPSTATTPTNAQAMTMASIDAARWHANDVLTRYLAAHKPTACGSTYRADATTDRYIHVAEDRARLDYAASRLARALGTPWL